MLILIVYNSSIDSLGNDSQLNFLFAIIHVLYFNSAIMDNEIQSSFANDLSWIFANYLGYSNKFPLLPGYSSRNFAFFHI